MSIFGNISSFHVPNFFWIFILDPNLRDESRRGVISVGLNKNQLLCKGIMAQASMDVFDKIYSLDEYIW